MEIRSAYKRQVGKNRRPIVTMNKEPTMTKQALVENADINKIIKKHGISHVLTNMTNLEVLYGEITSHDLQEAMQMNIDAEKAFMEVPADIRKKFGNDAGAFIDYATNAENLEQMRDWGLAPPPPKEPEPVKVEVTNPEPAPAE